MTDRDALTPKVSRVNHGEDQKIEVGFSGLFSRRIQLGDSLLLQRYYEELAVWKRLIHPNVIPTLGAGPDIGELCVTSPWMSEGDLL